MSRLPEHIPPRSVVRLARAGGKGSVWKSQLGREFRIGYYIPKDGMDCIWLVNERGEYEQTTDCEGLLRHFEIIQLSNETDYFGEHRPPLGRLSPARKAAGLKRRPAANFRRVTRATASRS